EAEAEDLVQETFHRAYRAFETFQLRQYGARPWLLKILHNTFYTRLGKAAREPASGEDIDLDNFAASPDAGSADEMAAAELDWDHFDQELKVAVASLAPEYREVLLLWALEDLSYKEIAEVCGCAIGTVMSRLYRARQQLSQKLVGYARDEGIR